MFVTDTHPLVWYTTAKYAQLSPKVLAVFQKADAGESLIYVPAVVLWEIALLEHLRKIQMKEKFGRWASALLAKNGFAMVPLETSIISQSLGYNFNNDIFDKVIVATAADLEIPLITKDFAITESNLVETYW